MQSLSTARSYGEATTIFFYLASTSDGSPVESGTPAVNLTTLSENGIKSRSNLGVAAVHLGGGVWYQDLTSSNLSYSHICLDVILAGAESVFVSVEIERGRTIDAIDVGDELTHVIDDYQSRTIIEVNQNFAGTIKLIPPDGTTLSSVASGNLAGAASVTGTNMRRTPDHKAALVDVPALSTTGTYTVTWTVVTTDSQTLVYTGTLIVY